MFGRDKTFGVGGLVQLSQMEGKWNQNIEHSLVITTFFLRPSNHHFLTTIV